MGAMEARGIQLGQTMEAMRSRVSILETEAAEVRTIIDPLRIEMNAVNDHLGQNALAGLKVDDLSHGGRRI